MSAIVVVKEDLAAQWLAAVRIKRIWKICGDCGGGLQKRKKKEKEGEMFKVRNRARIETMHLNFAVRDYFVSIFI
jgi:hypothetical protein